MTISEIKFDGIVGLTHHFGGLGVGNLASHSHRGQVANPQAAALQGLDKIAMLHSMGCRQAVLPPQPRPDFALLRACGYRGTPAEIIQLAHDRDPGLLSVAYSASSMWAANAATVTRSASAVDRRVHFTPANLVSSLHRSIETKWTTAVLREIFADDSFCVHDPLPSADALRDEGAANHMRLSDPGGETSWDLFVYGGSAVSKFPARQSLLACQAVARRHGLAASRVVFLEQHPMAIDAGAFHNDVVGTSCGNVLLHHEFAYADASQTLDDLAAEFHTATGGPLYRIEVKQSQLPLADAVATYLFNSQIVQPADREDRSMVLVCPSQCRGHRQVRQVIDRIICEANPIVDACFVDLQQSMNNGGGPACLRLRVPVDEHQAGRIKSSVLWSPQLEAALRDWVTAHYPTKLSLDDLGDFDLVRRNRSAMQQLSSILDLRTFTDAVSGGKENQ